MSTYVVAGVSGHTGAVVAQTLLDQKLKVRVLVREAAKAERWKKRGAEVAVASLDDTHAMGAALRGADVAYLLVPPPKTSETGILARSRRIVETVAQTVSGSHLKHVVFLSSVGAQHADGTGIVQGLHVAETAFSALKVPFTFLRASSFMENWGGALASAKDGVLPTFYPVDFSYPQVAAHDIGAVAAALLTDHPKSHQVVELAGPVEATPNDVAAILETLLGNEVKAVAQPVAQMGAALQGFGFSAEMAGLYQDMTVALFAGRVAFEHPDKVKRGKQTLAQTLGAMLKSS